MVLYYVRWIYSSKLAKGKGKVSNNEISFGFTVLCNNSKEAHRCLEYYFRFIFSRENKHDLTLDDGEIRMSRMTVDSRKFSAQYLLLDGMKQPFYLTDPSSNILRLDKIF